MVFNKSVSVLLLILILNVATSLAKPKWFWSVVDEENENNAMRGFEKTDKRKTSIDHFKKWEKKHLRRGGDCGRLYCPH